MSAEIDHLRYPVGRFQYQGPSDDATRRQFIEIIAQLPGQMREKIGRLSQAQLDTPYRPGGWTIRQVVHHVADSHLNSFIRFKLGLTEDTPTIKPYHQDGWAGLPDSVAAPVETSLQLLEGLHQRWVILLRSLRPTDWNKEVYHPEMKRNISLDFLLALYAWHCRHHLGHIDLVGSGAS